MSVGVGCVTEVTGMIVPGGHVVNTGNGVAKGLIGTISVRSVQSAVNTVLDAPRNVIVVVGHVKSNDQIPPAGHEAV